MNRNIVEEQITIDNAGLWLSGILSYPLTKDPKRCLLICPPHPLFAGNMENNVARSLANYFAEESLVLRFDYRGVGQSEINLPSDLSVFDYWFEIEVSHDYKAVLSDVDAALHALYRLSNGLPMDLIGYSFGAVIGLMAGSNSEHIRKLVGISPPFTKIDFAFLQHIRVPCLLICSRNDFVFSEEALHRYCTNKTNIQTKILNHSDHFFRGTERELCVLAEQFVFGPDRSEKR